MNNSQQIRADYDKDSIIVYQAYNKQIALPAIKNQRFSTPFSFQRMTWIKPSYLWMMERSNWGKKSNQEHILGIRMARSSWEKALSLSVLTHPCERIYKNADHWQQVKAKAKVNVQWDPERNLRGGKLDFRAIQVGIGRELIVEYNEEWIEEIIDYTPLTKKIAALCKAGKHKEAKRLLPKERLYPTPESLWGVIGIF